VGVVAVAGVLVAVDVELELVPEQPLPPVGESRVGHDQPLDGARHRGRDDDHPVGGVDRVAPAERDQPATVTEVGIGDPHAPDGLRRSPCQMRELLPGQRPGIGRRVRQPPDDPVPHRAVHPTHRDRPAAERHAMHV
jgi:hypothetical protein